jgi:hypothetical protein
LREQKITIHDQDRPLLTLGLSLVRRDLELRLAAQKRDRDRAEIIQTLARLERLAKRIGGY